MTTLENIEIPDSPKLVEEMRQYLKEHRRELQFSESVRFIRQSQPDNLFNYNK